MQFTRLKCTVQWFFSTFTELYNHSHNGIIQYVAFKVHPCCNTYWFFISLYHPVPLCGCTLFSLSVHQLVGIWVVSTMRNIAAGPVAVQVFVWTLWE